MVCFGLASQHDDQHRPFIQRNDVLRVGATTDEKAVTFIAWQPDDPRAPRNWSPARKIANVLWTTFNFTWIAANTTCIGVVADAAQEMYHVGRDGTLALSSVIVILMAFGSLVVAPLGERYGRVPVYHISAVLNALCFIPQALSTNFGIVIAFRALQGLSVSGINSMVGGTVADLYPSETRHFAMNVFTFMVFLGQGLGSVIFGWVLQRTSLSWVFGIQGIIAAFMCLSNFYILKETRHDVLLARASAELRRKAAMGQSLYICCEEDFERYHGQVPGHIMGRLIRSISLPTQMLITEPIVTVLSLWAGICWGCIYLGGTTDLSAFAAYGLSLPIQGTFQVCIVTGAMLGFCSSIHQQTLYTQWTRHAPEQSTKPEWRLYPWTMIGALAFPLGLLVFGWTGRPSVHWIVPALMLTLQNAGIYLIYIGIFNYLADTYETRSSSAQAAQSFTRNISSGVFPIIGHHLYNALSFPQSTSIVAGVALATGVAPFLLWWRGESLRRQSRLAAR